MVIQPLDPDVVAADVRPPALADLARRARRRTWQRRVSGAVAAIATVAAATTVLAGVHGTGRPDVTATPRPSASAPKPPEIFGDPIVFDRSTVLWRSLNACGVTVRLTTDAGRTWTEPGGPPLTDDCNPRAAGIPTITFTVVDPRTYRVTVDGTPWFTGDAGRTWTTPPTDAPAADSFGAGVPGESLECMGGCDRPRAVDPASGRLIPLSGDLPFDRLLSAEWADANTIWAVAAGQPLRATHSDDRGRTWSAPVTLPTVDKNMIFLPVDGQRAFVVERRNGPGTVAKLFRTDDGGVTWNQVDLPTKAVEGIAQNEQGKLLLLSVETGRFEAYTSTGGPFTGPVPVDAPDPIRGGSSVGRLWVSGSNRVVRVNDDGTTWYSVTLPD